MSSHNVLLRTLPEQKVVYDIGVNDGWEFVLELEISDAIVTGMLAEIVWMVTRAVDNGGSGAGGALIGVTVLDSSWVSKFGGELVPELEISNAAMAEMVHVV